MKLINILKESFSPSIKRFPLTLFFTVAAAFFCSKECISSVSLSQVENTLLLATCWGMFFSVFFQLVLEFFAEKGTVSNKLLHILNPVITLALCTGIYFLMYKSTDYNAMWYIGSIIISAILILFLIMSYKKKETVIPCILTSLIFSAIITICFGCGLSLILYATDTLLIDISNIWTYYEIIWICSFFIVFINTFISFCTKKESEYKIPEAFKVIFFYALLPLYALLLVVLYLYLLKSLFTLSLPKGKINWFVSYATIVYLLFYFALGNIKNTVTNFFHKYGSFFLFPLILIQCVSFFIRITAYGFTTLRYASLLYIIFSIWFCSMSLIKKGRYMYLSVPVFAIMVFIGTLTPLNIISIPLKEQTARLEKVLRKNNMLFENRIIKSPSDQSLSYEDKAAIISAYDEIKTFEKKPEWLADVNDSSFYDVFGFKYFYNGYRHDYEEPSEIYYRCDIRASNKMINITGYSSMCVSEYSSYDEKTGKFYIIFNDKKYDVTSFLKENTSIFSCTENDVQVIKEPLLIPGPEYDICISKIYSFIQYDTINKQMHNIDFDTTAYLLIK